MLDRAEHPRVLTAFRKFPTSRTVPRMSRMARQFRKSVQNTPLLNDALAVKSDSSYRNAHATDIDRADSENKQSQSSQPNLEQR